MAVNEMNDCFLGVSGSLVLETDLDTKGVTAFVGPTWRKKAVEISHESIEIRLLQLPGTKFRDLKK